jgi:hypothetical protein
MPAQKPRVSPDRKRAAPLCRFAMNSMVMVRTRHEEDDEQDSWFIVEFSHGSH